MPKARPGAWSFNIERTVVKAEGPKKITNFDIQFWTRVNVSLRSIGFYKKIELLNFRHFRSILTLAHFLL